jgi:NADH pyrophosphatase NudC (nudix superfamily)
MCKYCNELNKETEEIEIYELLIAGGYYIWNAPIKYCPNCGKELDKYKTDSYLNKNISTRQSYNNRKKLSESISAEDINEMNNLIKKRLKEEN